MICPRCYTDFSPGPKACPECGVHLLRSISGRMKTSAVMISAAGECGFYRSVQEVPEPLRQQLLRVTAGENSGTIVIADKAGKEQLTQVAARREAARGRGARTAGGRSGTGKPEGLVPGSRGRGVSTELSCMGLSWVVWAGILLLFGSAGVVAAVFTLHG